MLDALRCWFEGFVEVVGRVVFWDIWFWDDTETGHTLPLIVAWLGAGAIFCTLYFRFVNLRYFRHAIDCVRGRYSRPEERGEISHFQALSAALSATVGLGNIAGVALAVQIGGPGALLWMMVVGFLGMSSKFAECTLGQHYRILDAGGRVLGGPMVYLRRGLGEIGWPRLGGVLAVLFAVLCIGASLGGGNMFQAKSAYDQVTTVFPQLDNHSAAALFGVVLAVAVGLVIVGGIRRIGRVAATLVPAMCGLYVLAGCVVLVENFSHVGDALATIWREAFAPGPAITGGFLGVLVQGLRRAVFSNEAGIGSAPIAHSAATTDEPVREGLVALLEPFIDTILVCSMTGLVIVTSGVYLNPELQGIAITSAAFETVLPWFPNVLLVTALLFAYSTMISWSYYGERCWESLFGMRSILIYKGLFLGFVVLGATLDLQTVLGFSDLMLLSMAFPNLLGVFLLASVIQRELTSYHERVGKRGL